ncbi:MAG: hypothetical protein HXX09_13755, partial [Bacteroidetes bacterium]|nr:hypothetical protein [Bacteroidota bacterium]
MATNDFYTGETPQNYQQKCPVVFVIDVSGSMMGSPLIELNKGLQLFSQEIQADNTASERLDVALVSFGSDTVIDHDFALLQDYSMPTLTTRGSTKMVDGVRKG